MSGSAVAIGVSITPRILIVDDDIDLLNSLKEFFLALRYEADICQIPEDARRLIEEKGPDYYQIVAFDADFRGLSSFSGEDFVINNPHLFGKAIKTIISAGSWYTEERRKELESANIKFVAKSPKLGPNLVTITQAWMADVEQKVKIKTEELKAETGGHIDVIKITLPVGAGDPVTGAAPLHAAAPPGPPVPSQVSEVGGRELKGALIAWLRSRSDPDKKVFKCGSAIYSTNEMIEHVEEETEVGLDHIRMMIGEFKCFIGMGA